MVAALSLTLATACAPTDPVAKTPSKPVRVSDNGLPFQMWQGAAARKAADVQCGPRGVNASIYDRFDRPTGEWVYPDGCA